MSNLAASLLLLKIQNFIIVCNFVFILLCSLDFKSFFYSFLTHELNGFNYLWH